MVRHATMMVWLIISWALELRHRVTGKGPLLGGIRGAGAWGHSRAIH